MRHGRLLLPLLLLAPLLAAGPPTDVRALRTAAQAGDVEAQAALAEAYRVGRGVTIDPDTSIAWYRKAAAQGHVRAGEELGFMLFTHGSRREAIPFIEAAAARGDARAFYLLGTAHFNGDYVTKDWPLAFAQTTRAAEAGLPAAKKNLELMGRYLLTADRAKADQILATLPPIRARPAAADPPPAEAPPATTVAKAAPAPSLPPPPPRAPKRGAWKAQIGAYGSPDRARAGWRTLLAKVPRLRGLEQHVVPAGKVTRLQAWGLAGRSDADALCREVQRAGGACFPIAP